MTRRLRICNLIMSLAVIVTGVLSAINGLVSFKIAVLLLSFYSLYFYDFFSLFGSIQFMQELNCKCCRNWSIRWFGFLYSFRGRAIYYLLYNLFNFLA